MRRGSASGSDIGRSTPGQSPNELRFSLFHFLPRRTSLKPTGRETTTRSSCDNAPFVNAIRSSATDAAASRRTMNATTGTGSGAVAAPDLHLPPAAFSPLHPLQLLARCQALRRHLAEHYSWEDATPPLIDHNRVPDSSTLRRWSSSLDRSQPAASSLRQTLTRMTHWLGRGDQADPKAWPLSGLTPGLDFHDKTVLNDDWGVGIALQWLAAPFKYKYVAHGGSAMKGLQAKQLATVVKGKKKGPIRCPDFLAAHSQNKIQLNECKGNQRVGLHPMPSRFWLPHTWYSMLKVRKPITVMPQREHGERPPTTRAVLAAQVLGLIQAKGAVLGSANVAQRFATGIQQLCRPYADVVRGVSL